MDQQSEVQQLVIVANDPFKLTASVDKVNSAMITATFVRSDPNG